MGLFKTNEHITQPAFLEGTESLLGKANESALDFNEVHEAAQEVSTRLGQIATGKLIVDPPLSAEQVSGIQERTNVILNLSQRGIEALSGAKRTGSSKSRKFAGTGIERKS